MKFLFDENISSKLVVALEDLYPDSTHVYSCGLKGESDDGVWDFAKNNGFVIVTQDSDFLYRSKVKGFPPKVILLQFGNCPTKRIEMLLRNGAERFLLFFEDETVGCLVLQPKR